MQNKNSKLNTVLLIILILLLGVTIWMMNDKKATMPVVNEVVKNDNTANVVNGDLKEYKNDTLGLVFTYPASLGDLKIDISNDYKGFRFETDASSNLWIGGTSTGYEPEGREFYDIDLTEASMKDLCDVSSNQKIVTKDNTEGIFAFSRSSTFEESCTSSTKSYYAVFDVNKKVANIVFIGDPSKISETDFLNLVQSVSFR